MRSRLVLLLFVLLLATRLVHSGIIWVEEAYPSAAAIQLLHGKLIYRDFWYDKPPLTPLLYLLWGGYGGVILRIADAAFLTACCWMASKFGRDRNESFAAAGLLAFFLTFDTPSAVLALAPDLAMLLPHLAAVWLATQRRALAAGAIAGLALLVNPKGVFVLAVCLLWCWREWRQLGAGFLGVNAITVAALASTGALYPYYEQVWQWGALYSRDSFVTQPVAEGMRRTLAWAGFHATIVLAAALYWRRDRRYLAWAALTLAGVIMGWRFFPRYYFLLLPAVVIAASRGLFLIPPRWRLPLASLLLIPLIRFGPRYATLAVHPDQPWADTAMNVDALAASGLIRQSAKPGDTLLVWGYRPDMFLYTRMPAGTPFLDSQPLTGVIADRHLTQSTPSAPALAARNRTALTGYHPAWIVDGLGPYNPQLAISNYPDLAGWLADYQVAGRTTGSIVYHHRP